ncbi:patatin-like phospholipase family protein [Parafrankia sp. FMc6]|uniref:patatin-like phospholipase family protein n=1 Tax=Parafrankia soli TaxID=2599596 RepID=UPI0034D63B99
MDQLAGSGLRREDLTVRGGLGLVVQGGGMRGVFAMGALDGLARMGLTSTFDLCIGSSAGAISLSYFLAGQSNEVDESYWAAIKSSRTFKPTRVWRIIDVNRLVEDVIFGSLPLKVDALRNNPSRLLVGMTDADLRLPHYMVAQEADDDELKALLRATSALPGLSNSKVHIRGRRYLDGGFVDPLPINRLKMLGCDRLVVITTNPLTYTITNDSWGRRNAIKLLSVGQHRLVRQWIGTPNPLHDENLEALLWWSRDPERSKVLSIAPTDPLPDLTQDLDLLHRIFLSGREAAQRAIASVSWIPRPADQVPAASNSTANG